MVINPMAGVSPDDIDVFGRARRAVGSAENSAAAALSSITPQDVVAGAGRIAQNALPGVGAISQATDVAARAGAGAPDTAAPVMPNVNSAATSAPTPARRSLLPDDVARYGPVNGSQIYIGKGAHGEPVFSDTAQGAQNINQFTGRKATGDGAIPASLDATDPNAIQRRAVGTMRAQDAAGLPGGSVGGLPDQYRQPVAPGGSGPNQGAATDARIARLRAAPGGDTAFAPNSSHMSPQDALRLNPMARQALVENVGRTNADPNLDPETRASNVSLLNQVDTNPKPGTYNPSGYPGAGGGQPGFSGIPGLPGALSPKDILRNNLDNRKQSLKELEAERTAEEKGQDRANSVADRDNADLKDAIPNPVMRRSVSSVRSLLDNFNRDPNYLNSDSAREGVGNLYRVASKALHRRGMLSTSPGTPTGGINPGSPLSVEENQGIDKLFGKYTLGDQPQKKGPDGNWVPAQKGEPGAARNTFGDQFMGTSGNADPETSAIFGKDNENLGGYKDLLDAISTRQHARANR